MASLRAVAWYEGNMAGRQSALAPFGREAAETLTAAGWMTLAGGVIFAVVLVLIAVALRTPGERLGHRGGMRVILWAGAVGPAVLLFVLLVATLPAMRPIRAAESDLRIAVTGEQFWWRVGYRAAGAAEVVSANEVRVPVGRTVVFDLTAGDVLHSFWVPGLAGKVDMIPGRTNRLVVRANRPGRFRGQCAEFCGLSHALMAFDVVAMPAAAFDAWLAREAQSADPTGAARFAAWGCGGCHAVRGTGAAGAIGPDLTHIGARATIGAGIRPNTVPELSRFIRAAPDVKPGSRMPAYLHMSEAEAQAIARYLKGLT